jgi:hypothetical protein
VHALQPADHAVLGNQCRLYTIDLTSIALLFVLYFDGDTGNAVKITLELRELLFICAR